ncbi:TPA: hypothetical protein MB355_003673, partial [Klebsiella quasipneumoniae subsp. similipneumoniae]
VPVAAHRGADLAHHTRKLARLRTDHEKNSSLMHEPDPFWCIRFAAVRPGFTPGKKLLGC